MPKFTDVRRGALAEWVVTIIMLLFGMSTLAQAFVIPTVSMEDTLLVGDHLIVDKLAYAPPGRISGKLLPYTPVRRGDIIVFHPPLPTKDPYVKRVIGVPGDRIRIVNKQVFRNGQALAEPYKFHKTSYIDSYRDNFPSAPNTMIYPGAAAMLREHVIDGEVVVPPGNYFAMGDNRDLSLDSRYWGLVARDTIVGKPVIIYWSYDAPTEWLESPLLTADYARDLALHFFTKTRWSRMFHSVRGYRSGADDREGPVQLN
jgi:signal peptidase I